MHGGKITYYVYSTQVVNDKIKCDCSIRVLWSYFSNISRKLIWIVSGNFRNTSKSAPGSRFWNFVDLWHEMTHKQQQPQCYTLANTYNSSPTIDPNFKFTVVIDGY